MIRLFENTVFKIIFALVILTVIFINLSQGLYIDENGLLVIYRAIYQGERMFVDSWGEYHMAGVLMYPIFALYYQVLEPMLSTMGIGIVLYTRIMYMIVRLLVTIYLYFTLRKTEFKDGAFYASLLYFVFIVGWRNFSYKSICDLGLILLCCFVIRYGINNQGYYFVLMGIATCICILAYPTMIVLPFAFVIGGLILSHKGYTLFKHLITYSVTCFVCGGLFLVYLQLTAGILKAFEYFGKYSNTSYDDGFMVRTGMMVLSYVVVFVIAYIPIVIIELYKKSRALSVKAEESFLAIYWIVFMIAVCVARIESVNYSRFIYGILILFFWFPYITREKKELYIVVGSYKSAEVSMMNLLKMVFVISCVAQAIWALSTNQDISIPGHMAYYVAIAVVLVAAGTARYKYLTTGLILASVFFGCVWLPEANGGYHDVFQDRYYVNEGALRGIALSEYDYEKNQQVMELMNDYVTPEDNLLVTFAFNSTAYLNTDARIAMGSPYMRPQIDTQLLTYWENCPDYVANLVLIDKGIDKYPELLESECGQYLLSEYTNQVAVKGDLVLLSK